MLKTLTLLAAIVAAAPAWAGSITFSASPGGLTKTQTLTDAEVARVVAWAKATYGNGQSMTNAEAFDAVASGIFRGIRDNVLNYERELAKKPAGDAILPIGVP